MWTAPQEGEHFEMDHRFRLVSLTGQEDSVSSREWPPCARLLAGGPQPLAASITAARLPGSFEPTCSTSTSEASQNCLDDATEVLVLHADLLVQLCLCMDALSCKYFCTCTSVHDFIILLGILL